MSGRKWERTVKRQLFAGLLLPEPALLCFSFPIVYNELFTRISMRPLLEVSNDELLAWLQRHSQAKMRARQIRRWIIAGRAESFEQMTDLPRDLRAALAAEFTPLASAIVRHLEAHDNTHKLLLRPQDGQLI